MWVLSAQLLIAVAVLVIALATETVCAPAFLAASRDGAVPRTDQDITSVKGRQSARGSGRAGLATGAQPVCPTLRRATN
jgi:hypothetical protein